ncbi:MAG: hypothetical protein HC831_28960 [Chloroflexia bacterium]|nr:hypothetical protein [Chloroflexia bacterium]
MYTLSINTNKEKLDAILNFLKAFEVDFELIEFDESIKELPELSFQEYKKRYEFTLNNMEEGLTINEMESKLYPDEEV